MFVRLIKPDIPFPVVLIFPQIMAWKVNSYIERMRFHYWGTRIRTLILATKKQCLAVRRSPNINKVLGRTLPVLQSPTQLSRRSRRGMRRRVYYAATVSATGALDVLSVTAKSRSRAASMPGRSRWICSSRDSICDFSSSNPSSSA